MAQRDLEATLGEQREYYAARASESDDAYRRTGDYDRGPHVNAIWQSAMASAARAFDEVPLVGDVVELAAGTGFWTERLVSRVRSLTMIDGSAAMIAANRKRLGPAAALAVHYEVADLFDWHPLRTWDACMFGFWLCHVPDDRLMAFLRAVASSLRPNGVVCFVDKAADVDPDSEWVDRTLGDGRRFTIIDHPRPSERLIVRSRLPGSRSRSKQSAAASVSATAHDPDLCTNASSLMRPVHQPDARLQQ